MKRLLALPVLALLALIIGVTLPPSPAEAAAPDPDGTVTWMVRPSDGGGEDGRSWVELELDPGEQVQEHLLVRNLSPSTVTFQVSAADGYFTDTGRFNMLTSDQVSVGAGTWIDVQDTVEVPSGADVIVPFTVTVPENAPPGDHPAGIAAAIRSGSDEEVGIESRVGFRVMTRVTGELAPAATAQIDAEYRNSWNPFSAGGLDVDYDVTNTGNTRLSIIPQITVSGPLGLVELTASGDEIVEIAPGETRTGKVTLPTAWPLFAYSVEISATAVTVGGQSPSPPPTVQASVTVVAVPWAQVIVLMIAALLVWKLRRDHRRREDKLTTLVEQARQQGREEVAAGAQPGDA